MKKDNFDNKGYGCNSEHCKCNGADEKNKHCTNENKKCNCEKDQINSLKKENEKLNNDLLRSFADMENLKKRTEIDIQNNRNYITSNIIKSFVNVADNLERAVSTYEKNKNDVVALIDGIKMINTEFTRVLNSFGVERIKTVGEIFNPELHQAVSMKAPEKDNDVNKIAEEVQIGYTLDGKVIKPSLVVVYKN